MKLYATSIPQHEAKLSNCCIKKAGLIEVEINDEDPGFHSILEDYLLKLNQELLV
ncbi:MAG: hypothetical protein ACYTXE_25375 [Nostoc sp.]